jgi:hypothetical protein
MSPSPDNGRRFARSKPERFQSEHCSMPSMSALQEKFQVGLLRSNVHA